MSDKPRILILTGDGKGKTTAAMGMAFRAAGHRMKVKIIQFIKNDSNTGEITAVGKFANMEIRQYGKGFVPKPSSENFETHHEAAEKGLRQARRDIKSGNYDLVILDEICTAVSLKLLKVHEVLETLKLASGEIRIVLTGRGAAKSLIDAADTVSEINCLKHAYYSGTPAQKGVEW